MIRRNKYETNFVAASGALGLDGRGWPHEVALGKLLGTRFFDPTCFDIVWSKTFTLQTKPRNWIGTIRRTRVFRGGTLNADGLRNPGFGFWEEQIAPNLDPLTNYGLSVHGTLDEIGEMARRTKGSRIKAIQVNGSCPNTGQDLPTPSDLTRKCAVVRENTDLPIGLKVSVEQDTSGIVRSLEEIGVSWIDLNTVRWAFAYPNRRSPLRNYGGGGVGGRIIQHLTWPYAKSLSQITSIKVIWPSVWTWQDVESLVERGADGIAYGSVFIPYFWRPTMYTLRAHREFGKLT